jgi:bifunctional DNA-binding transcriptional regulator/antitoxin component of YhaV-PrlF toxin-antitoxin module
MKNPGDDREAPPFFEPYPGSVLLLQARYVLAIGKDGEIALPAEVRWGFALNEGDLLICERRWNELTLTSYSRTVLAALDACEAPWPVLEREALSRPLERVNPGGTVRLPEEYRTETGLGPGDRVELDARIDGLNRELVVRPRVRTSTEPD